MYAAAIQLALVPCDYSEPRHVALPMLFFGNQAQDARVFPTAPLGQGVLMDRQADDVALLLHRPPVLNWAINRRLARETAHREAQTGNGANLEGRAAVIPV